MSRLTISGTQSHGAGAILTVSTGTLNLDTNAGSIASPGTLTINANSTTNFNVTQNLAALNIGPAATATLLAGGGRSIKTASLTIDGSGALDLTDRGLVVDYSDTSVASQVRGYLISGRNGGTWNGPGIRSSAFDGGILHALGYAEASDALGLIGTQTAMWHGQSVDATSVLAQYTYGGDANLDGRIDVIDYGRIDLNAPLGTSGWFNGDFNYDGKIDVLDYGIIDFTVAIQGAPLDTLEAPRAGFADRFTAVPEPSALALLTLGALLGCARRSHRYSTAFRN
jgi:hypothetical protein